MSAHAKVPTIPRAKAKPRTEVLLVAGGWKMREWPAAPVLTSLLKGSCVVRAARDVCRELQRSRITEAMYG